MLPPLQPFGRRVDQPLSGAVFSPNGRWIALVGATEAQVWDAGTGMPVSGIMKHAGQIYTLSFSPDGLAIATASSDNTAMIWNAATRARWPTCGASQS